MTPELYFLLMILGVPVAILGIAIVGARFYDDGTEQLLDWKPRRSARKEAELYVSDTQDLLTAVNRYRRLRGAPDRSLEEITEHSWANLDQCD
jgi:hypothetical protein